MNAPNPATIITRAVLILGVIIALLYGSGYLKKKQRINALVKESQALASDSSFFHQFYPEDSRKTLVRAIGLIAEANEFGIPPNAFIDRTLGIEKPFFNNDREKEEEPRQKLIRRTLASNYDNFRKLGYDANPQTLAAMREGKLPTIPSGPMANSKAEVGTIIDPALSPGLEKIVANLQIRPPSEEKARPSDVEIAAAKRLANDLAISGVIESTVRDRLIRDLSVPEPEDTGE